jgi:hypothetical protein
MASREAKCGSWNWKDGQRPMADDEGGGETPMRSRRREGIHPLTNFLHPASPRVVMPPAADSWSHDVTFRWVAPIVAALVTCPPPEDNADSNLERRRPRRRFYGTPFDVPRRGEVPAPQSVDVGSWKFDVGRSAAAQPIPYLASRISLPPGEFRNMATGFYRFTSGGRLPGPSQRWFVLSRAQPFA